ncbi:hypothetical protein ACFL96_10850, partial [Thermoproteota archaeon]
FQTMPMGHVVKGKFKPYYYKKPHFYLMGIKADLIVDCLRSVFTDKTIVKKHMPFLYYFNAQDPRTYPA